MIKKVEKKYKNPGELERVLKQNYPSIVRIFRVHEGGEGEFFFVMEYCCEGDLDCYLRENGRLSEELTKRLIQVFVLIYFILFYFILFYFILFYFILFYFILFYFILFYFILFYFILFYFILFYFILFYFILFYCILFYCILF